MSSSNSVRVAFIDEALYGVTPAAGNFETARFTSESLSGSPQTTESAMIRTDRLSSGQVVTGLDVGGSLNVELAKEAQLEKFMASAMMSNWASTAPVAVALTIDTATKSITRASGDFTADLHVGDMLKLTGFTNLVNNTVVMVTEIDSATVINFTSSATVVDEVGVGTSYQLADKISIGSIKKSFSMEKAFLDVPNKGLIYRGMLASKMSFKVAYGSIITGEFGFMGNDYKAVALAADMITNLRTINPPATSNAMNGSIDMPFLASSAVGTLDKVGFCVQEVGIELDNGLSAQNCIGTAAPAGYSAGQANIKINLSAYLSSANWDILSKKLTQESFAMGFVVKNGDGWYGFYLPAVQVTMDDPASGGQNQDVVLSMTGSAKVGSNGESALYLYRSN
jgi:hypothetical protein